MSRLFKFVFRHIFTNTRFLLAYAYLYFQKEARIDVNTYSFKELREKIKEGKSIIRYGDGEVYIMNYGSIHYENYNKELRQIFLNSIRNYSKNKDKYLLGVNDWALQSTNSELKQRNTFYGWLPYKAFVCLNFNLIEKYFDAALFYRKEVFEDYVLPYIQNKKIILVSRKENLNHVASINFFNNIKYVETPEFHSYTKIKEIEEQIDLKIKEYNDDDADDVNDIETKNKDIVLLVSCGPASKAICYKYSLLGVQSLDIGRGIELIGTGKDLEIMLK